MRYLIVIVALIAGLGALAGVKALQIRSLIQFGQTMAKAGPPAESVNTARAVAESWGGTLTTVGSVVSVRGVSLSNEVAGVVSRLGFESGARVRAGQVILELDASVEKAQLGSTQARLALARQTLERSRALAPSGAIPTSQLEVDESSVNTLSAELKALQAQIDRKTVHAPFDGRLGIRAVNLGQYLAPGTTLAVLESPESVFVDFTLPQADLSQLHVGMSVLARPEGENTPPIAGTISAIEPALDPATRSVRLRAGLNNKEERLRPGMFVRVAVVLPDEKPVVAVPATAIVHATYGDSLFVVEPKKSDAGEPVLAPDGKPVLSARQQFVRVGSARGDFVAIVAGVNAGEEIVVGGAFKLRNGASIAIKNDVKLEPQLHPTPENH
jgi:membrane fusion protein (multidrug efflux system)